MDVAMNFLTGDIILGTNRDIAGISGPSEIVQRIHIRLMIERGTWMDDPTDGQLGSRLHGLLGMKAGRVMGEVGILIREALEPMHDIVIQEVDVELSEDERTVLAHILYRDIGDPNETEIQETATINLPLIRT